MNELLDYGFVEATAFEGLMPAAAEKIGTVGASDVVVKHFGCEAKGVDALEMVDVEAVLGGEKSEATETTEDVVVDDAVVDGE